MPDAAGCRYNYVISSVVSVMAGSERKRSLGLAPGRLREGVGGKEREERGWVRVGEVEGK